MSLEDALLEFTHCIGVALDDVCSYGLTIGEAYVPFEPDPEDECEEGEEFCEQAWVRVMSVTPRPGANNMEGETCDLILAAELEVGVLRCIEVPEKGAAPTASDMLVAATQAMTDMQTIHRAAMGCEVWDLIVTGQWVPSGPLGGQYGGTWTFTVELPGDCLVSGNESV